MFEISVVLPTYNRAKTLRTAIDSVFGQKGEGESFRIRELIVVDDGSTDDTARFMESIADDRLRYIQQKENRGAAHARNIGVEKAQAEWIAFQDSDDLWTEDKLQKQTAYLLEHPECHMVVHLIRALMKDGQEIINEAGDAADQFAALAGRNFVGTPTILIRRQDFLECGGFDEKMHALEDWEFGLRYAVKGRIGIVQEALLQADMRVEGMSANMYAYYEGRCYMLAKHKETLMAHGCFEAAMESLFLHAREHGVLEQTAKMMELYLTNGDLLK